MRVTSIALAGGLLLAAPALTFPAMPAAAQSTVPLGGLRADPDAPVQIEADSLDVSQNDGSAHVHRQCADRPGRHEDFGRQGRGRL